MEDVREEFLNKAINRKSIIEVRRKNNNTIGMAQMMVIRIAEIGALTIVGGKTASWICLAEKSKERT